MRTDNRGIEQPLAPALFTWGSALYFLAVLTLMYTERYRVHPSFLDYDKGISPLTLFNLSTLPIIGVYLLLSAKAVRFPYLPAMLCILFGSLAATKAAEWPFVSVYQLGFEAYCYGWFVIMVSLLSATGQLGRRIILWAWISLAILNGCFILAQLVFPELHEAMAVNLSMRGKGLPRPAGLMGNSNLAALAQLSAVLVLLRTEIPPWPRRMLALFLCVTIVPTGSVSALLALVLALIAFTLSLAALQSYTTLLRMFRVVCLGGLLIAGGAAVTWWVSPESVHRIVDFTAGHMERSVQLRVFLWNEGAEILKHDFGWGIGPGRFQQISAENARLHNEPLAALVERGWLGLAGFLLFALLMLKQSLQALPLARARQVPAGWAAAIGGAVVAILFLAQLHELFRTDTLWLVLALLEVSPGANENSAAGAATGDESSPARGLEPRPRDRVSGPNPPECRFQ